MKKKEYKSPIIEIESIIGDVLTSSSTDIEWPWGDYNEE